MEAARAWGKSPWELVGGSPAIWWLRFKVLREIDHEVAQLKQQQAEQAAFLKGLS